MSEKNEGVDEIPLAPYRAPVKIDSSVILLRSKQADLLDPWTILFPDGAVYTAGDETSGGSGYFEYYCQYANFKPKKDDMFVAGGSKINPAVQIPPEVADLIQKLMVA